MKVYECEIKRVAVFLDMISTETFYFVPEQNEIRMFRKEGEKLRELKDKEYTLNVRNGGNIEYRLLKPEETEEILKKIQQAQ